MTRKHIKQILAWEEVAETPKVDIDRNVERANLYMNVPNVFTDDVPKESAVGAIAVNPNTK